MVIVKQQMCHFIVYQCTPDYVKKVHNDWVLVQLKKKGMVYVEKKTLNQGVRMIYILLLVSSKIYYNISDNSSPWACIAKGSQTS